MLGEVVFGDVAVDAVEEPAQLEIGAGGVVGERAGELGSVAGDADELAGDLDAGGVQGVEVEGSSLGCADELGGWQPSGSLEVVDGVVALVEQADRVHPPVDVSAPVGAREPDVVADGEGHGASGALELVGDLDAGGRGADDEHATGSELAGVAVRAAQCSWCTVAGRACGDGGECAACGRRRWRRPPLGSAIGRGRCRR